MILPLCEFFAALIIVGGIWSLIVTADKESAHKAPYAYALLAAGIGLVGTLIALGTCASMFESIGFLKSSLGQTIAGIAIFLIVGLNTFAAAMFGFNKGKRRIRTARCTMIDE